MILRELRIHDIKNEGSGFFETLESVWPDKITDDNRKNAISEYCGVNENALIYVALIDDKIVGMASLYWQLKFIRGVSMSGHIEEVVVHKDHQGKGIGRKLIEKLIERAKDGQYGGCYKISLNCSDDVVGFYEKLGFKRVANEMKMYL